MNPGLRGADLATLSSRMVRIIVKFYFALPDLHLITFLVYQAVLAGSKTFFVSLPLTFSQIYY